MERQKRSIGLTVSIIINVFLAVGIVFVSFMLYLAINEKEEYKTTTVPLNTDTINQKYYIDNDEIRIIFTSPDYFANKIKVTATIYDKNGNAIETCTNEYRTIWYQHEEFTMVIAKYLAPQAVLAKITKCMGEYYIPASKIFTTNERAARTPQSHRQTAVLKGYAVFL